MEKEIIQKIANEFFEKLSIQVDSLEVIKEEEHIYSVLIKTPDSWLLIGYSGRTLEDVKILLRSLLSKKLEHKSFILHLEINDYLERKEDKLKNFISKKIKELSSSKPEIILPYFNSYERKKIHWFVSEFGDTSIYTKSVGEWKQRKLHICKKFNISLDLDWVDI